MPVQTEQSAICKQGFNNECTSPAFICFKPSQSHTHWHHARHKLESILKEIFKEQPAAGISVIIFDVAISDTLMQSVSSPGIQPSPGRELSGVRSRWVDNYGRSNLASQQAGTGGKCQKPANVSQTLVQGYPNCYKWFLQDWHFKHCLLHDVISLALLHTHNRQIKEEGTAQHTRGQCPSSVMTYDLHQQPYTPIQCRSVCIYSIYCTYTQRQATTRCMQADKDTLSLFSSCGQYIVVAFYLLMLISIQMHNVTSPNIISMELNLIYMQNRTNTPILFVNIRVA